MEGMAAQDTAKGHPRPFKGTIAREGFHGVFGTARMETAVTTEQGADCVLIDTQKANQRLFYQGSAPKTKPDFPEAHRSCHLGENVFFIVFA
jgi:hypothetical protein